MKWLRSFIWWVWRKLINPLSANFTKWPNTLKQFAGKLPTNRLSVFDHFVGLALKELKDEHFDYLEGWFLDLMISIIDNQFCTKLFDKRNNFPISFVRIPYLDSNILSNYFYSAFKTEILRSARTINDPIIFQIESKFWSVLWCNKEVKWIDYQQSL